MKSKLLWPLTVLGALFVGLIALVVSRVRVVWGVIYDSLLSHLIIL